MFGLKGVDEKSIGQGFTPLNSKVPLNVLSVYLSVDNYPRLKEYLKKKFKIVKAAGGLVVKKKKKFLMIYRMKKWDLPKGKKEKMETYKEAAVREVGEECNVSVKSGYADLYHLAYVYDESQGHVKENKVVLHGPGG